HSHHITRRTTMQMTIMRLLAPRPTEVPADALIFNSKRELCGDQHWVGDWQHGIFYVAVYRTNQYAENYIRETVKLDGWLCEYITEDTIRTWAEAHAKDIGCKVESVSWNIWVETYMKGQRTRDVDLDEWLKTNLPKTS